jgi:hypothetical protein
VPRPPRTQLPAWKQLAFRELDEPSIAVARAEHRMVVFPQVRPLPARRTALPCSALEREGEREGGGESAQPSLSPCRVERAGGGWGRLGDSASRVCRARARWPAQTTVLARPLFTVPGFDTQLLLSAGMAAKPGFLEASNEALYAARDSAVAEAAGMEEALQRALDEAEAAAAEAAAAAAAARAEKQKAAAAARAAASARAGSGYGGEGYAGDEAGGYGGGAYPEAYGALPAFADAPHLALLPGMDAGADGGRGARGTRARSGRAGTAAAAADFASTAAVLAVRRYGSMAGGLGGEGGLPEDPYISATNNVALGSSGWETGEGDMYAAWQASQQQQQHAAAGWGGYDAAAGGGKPSKQRAGGGAARSAGGKAGKPPARGARGRQASEEGGPGLPPGYDPGVGGMMGDPSGWAAYGAPAYGAGLDLGLGLPAAGAGADFSGNLIMQAAAAAAAAATRQYAESYMLPGAGVMGAPAPPLPPAFDFAALGYGQPALPGMLGGPLMGAGLMGMAEAPQKAASDAAYRWALETIQRGDPQRGPAPPAPGLPAMPGMQLPGYGHEAGGMLGDAAAAQRAAINYAQALAAQQQAAMQPQPRGGYPGYGPPYG